MTKNDFVLELRKKLSGLPSRAVEEQISFYVEIIEDKIEEGKSEEKAVSEIGSVDYIASQIIEETPFTKIAIEKLKPKNKHKGLKTALLIIGSPIWLSLAIAFFAVVFSLYVVCWSLVVSLWAVEISMFACAIGGGLAFIVFLTQGHLITAFALLGLTMVCLGLAILGIYVCKFIGKCLLSIVKIIFRSLKNGFSK